MTTYSNVIYGALIHDIVLFIFPICVEYFCDHPFGDNVQWKVDKSSLT